jgi:lipopolysaccharide export system protein LptC
MAVELHLPDLPQVPVSVTLGAPRDGTPRPPVHWSVRLRDALATYLPLLLMALLALGSWWLVKNVPVAPAAQQTAPKRTEPDYTMSGFTLERFEPNGRLKLRLVGAQMRHFPDTDRIEIEGLKLQTFAPDGRITKAEAQRALSNGDSSEVQLFGAARVDSTDKKGQPVVLTSEFLHLFTQTEQLRTHLPAVLQHAGSVLRSTGMAYDNVQGRLDLTGASRLVLPPPGKAAGP